MVLSICLPCHWTHNLLLKSVLIQSQPFKELDKNWCQQKALILMSPRNRGGSWRSMSLDLGSEGDKQKRIEKHGLGVGVEDEIFPKAPYLA